MSLEPFLNTLSSAFFRFYLFALVCLVLTTLGGDLLVKKAIEKSQELQQEHFLRAAYFMAETDLMRYPQIEWSARVQALNRQYDFNFALHSLKELRLTIAQRYLLGHKQVALSADGRVVYFSLGETDRVLSVARYPPTGKPNLLSENFPISIIIRVSSWIIIGFLLCAFLWRWARPLFQDMESMQKTVHTLSKGELMARLDNVKSPLFKPLATTLNSMADRIQHLVNVQKEISSAISHELRTPVARIRFIAEMIAESNNLEECRHLSEIMETDLEELDQLLDSSLTYSRFERDNLQLVLAAVNITEWLEEQVYTARILAQHLNEFLLETDMIPPGHISMIDENRMNRAISNLLRNAVKYARGYVWVHANLQDGQILIHVDDDGIGVPEKDRDYIFTPFARLDRSRDRATGGHGLGLTICKRVLELHSGTVTVSESPLGGARFTMAWPAHLLS